jgi:hypothetical protein
LPERISRGHAFALARSTIMDDKRKAERDKLVTELLRIGKRHPKIARRLAALEQKPESLALLPGQSQRSIED